MNPAIGQMDGSLQAGHKMTKIEKTLRELEQLRRFYIDLQKARGIKIPVPPMPRERNTTTVDNSKRGES